SRASLFFFFFFQAEDGIRVFHVTGVQTCALPISKLMLASASRSPIRPASQSTVIVGSSPAKGLPGEDTVTDRSAPATGSVRLPRSEERRVGKECRARGAADHYKKNTTHHTSRTTQ